MREPEIRNAQILSTALTMSDHGCLTFWITINCCNIGGYCIGHGYLDAKEFDADGRGLECMMRIMNVVGVSKWEDLKGKYIRFVDRGLGSYVTRIGNITEDKWFDIDAFFKEKEQRITDEDHCNNCSRVFTGLCEACCGFDMFKEEIKEDK